MKSPFRHGRHKRMFRMGAAGTTRRARRAWQWLRSHAHRQRRFKR